MTTTDPEPEVIEAEVVDETPPTVEIERATVPVPMPAGPSPLAELSTIPGAAELQTLAQLATTFAYSALVPKPLQGKPEDVLLVLLTARDLGLSATVALRECHPIDGRVTVSPKLRMAIVRQRSLGRIWPDPDNDVNHHTWNAARADDPQTVYSVRYMWADAVRAGLVQAGCTPDDHSEQCQKGSGFTASRAEKAKACKSNWRTYPGQMLQWRAIGYLMDQAFGEVGVGLYSADELGAVTDEDGRIIDVMESGPIDGMPDRTPQPPEPGTDPNEVVEEEVRAGFKERIMRLPAPAIETLREQWARQDPQTGFPTILPLPRLPRRQVKVAEAIIAGFEKRATKGEWGPWNPSPLSTDTADPPATDELRGVEAPGSTEVGAEDPPDGTAPQSAPPEEAGPARPYDPKHPPSEVLEAAIDRANATAEEDLDTELEAVGQKVIENHKPDTKRRRLVQAWLVACWTPDGWESADG